MKIFKLRVSDNQCFELTKEIFETETNLQAPWYNQSSGKEKHYAVCPACNNSTQIVYLYNPSKTPYAKHFLGVSVGEQNIGTLKYCPYYSNKPSLKPENKRNKEDEISIEIKRLLIENFDRVIYFINKTIGIRLPYNTDKLIQILEIYKSSRGWMYVGANLINIPWIFLYQCRSQSLAGMVINKAEIKEAIIQYDKDITFNNYNQLIYPEGRFSNINLCFIAHKQSIENDELNETILLKITGDNDIEIYKEIIEFDHSYFINLINSTNNDYRKNELIQLAKDVLN